MKEQIDLACRLGHADVVVGQIRGKFADGGTISEYMTSYRKSLEACIAYAEKSSIRIVHEAIGRTDSDVLRTISENVMFIESFSSPNFRLQIDSHHMGLEEQDFYSAVLQTKGLLAQVDISDTGRASPDGRHFDFPTLLKALKKIDYQNYLVFEYKPQGDALQEAARALQYIRTASQQLD